MIPGNIDSCGAVLAHVDFFLRLVRFETELWNRVEHELRDHGDVGLGTLMALRALQAHGDAGRVHDLSVELCVTVGAASKLVDRLERDGLAARRPHPEDGRSSLVALTARGRHACASADETARDAVAGAIGDGPEVAAASDALQRLQSRLDGLEASVLAEPSCRAAVERRALPGETASAAW